MPNTLQTRERAELEQHPYPDAFYHAKIAAKVFEPVEGSPKSKVKNISLGQINAKIDRDVSLSVLEDILSLQKNQVYLLSYIDYDESTSPYFANLYREK
ncbi:hypothetical protein [Vagococcus luciliae]|uniref:Transcriptional regulator n=1 Tax=Vagococcus luciliae TaxID=2920380 RepID=A0ABY5P283_9ENTE|nr:hypothetical protein [Vagococcus luciliae]UUV99924.1 hypothetical protein G314FT_20930 [Vagococcus luciliae]